jgi:hypothetical protein
MYDDLKKKLHNFFLFFVMTAFFSLARLTRTAGNVFLSEKVQERCSSPVPAGFFIKLVSGAGRIT